MTRAVLLAMALIAAGFNLASADGALAAYYSVPSCFPSAGRCTQCIEYSGRRCTKCGRIPGCVPRAVGKRPGAPAPKPSYAQCVRGCLAKCGMWRDPKTGECKGSTKSH